MTILQIECFLKVADTGSLSRAAQKLYVSQPTISRHIQSLESELGFPVFLRSPSGMKLTDSGKILYNTWHSILPQHQAAISQAKALSEPDRLRIGLFDFGNGLSSLTAAILDYNRKYPSINVEFDIYTGNELCRLLQSGELNLVLTYDSEASLIPNIHMQSINQESIRAGLVFARSHPLARKRHITFQDLAGETIGIISEQFSSDYRNRITRLLENIGILNQVTLIEFSSRHSLELAVATGKCVSIVYETFVNTWHNSALFYPLEVPDHFGKVVIAWLDDRFSGQAADLCEILNRTLPNSH